MSKQPRQARVVEAAEKFLARQKFVTPLDICMGIGWLPSAHVDDWKQGRVATLEQVLPVDGGKLADLTSIRHLDPNYHDMLMSDVARADARQRIRLALDNVLAA